MSQNELQRVVALSAITKAWENHDDNGVVRLTMKDAQTISEALSRIEAAQAVAPGGVPDDVMQAIRWKLDTGDHTLDETCCCQPYCEACKAEQGEWKEVWNADRDLLQEVFDKYSMLAAAPASEAKGHDEHCDFMAFSTGNPECTCKPAASSAAGECKTCGGHGMIGYTTGQTPEQFEQHEAPCPDCNEPDDAEQEQAGELPELPEPVSSVALAAWGPKPDYYTADQMHEYARAALLRRAARVGPIDELYWQLIYAVASKFPNETRHETALRYINERENASSQGGQSAAIAAGEGK